MSENRFDYCKNAPAVMDEYVVKFYADTDIKAMRSEALARIRELTPRTVDEERVKEARGIMDYYLNMAYRREGGSRSIPISLICEAVDRIIDALGITDPVAPGADALPPTCCDQINPCAEHLLNPGRLFAIPHDPAVDVDADTLRLIVSLSEWSDVRVPHDLEGIMNAVRFALYRDEDGKTRVVIGGAP